MARRGLTLLSVARDAGVNYTAASHILSGRRDHPCHLEKIEQVIKATPITCGEQEEEITLEEFHEQMRGSLRGCILTKTRGRNVS